MPLYADIVNEKGYKFDQQRIRQILEFTLVEQGIAVPVEINVFVVDSEQMSDLHAEFMTTREPTDVLSFPLWENPISVQNEILDPDGRLRLGDIVICFEVAERQASENDRTTDQELEFLANHGCLHLLGIHHA